MRLEIFKPEDFLPVNPKCDKLSDFCNKKLNDYIQSLPKVKGKILKESNLTDEHGPGFFMTEESTRMNKDATHSAFLINIQELKKECVEHEPMYGKPGNTDIFCKCGVKLKATWSEV